MPGTVTDEEPEIRSVVAEAHQQMADLPRPGAICPTQIHR